MWFDGTKTHAGPALVFQPQHDGFICCSADAQNRISRGREQRRLGGGAQPVFRAAGDAAKRAGATNRRAAGDAAGVCKCRLAPNVPPPRGIQTALVYPAQTLSANSTVERQIVFFAGPKEYRTLARIGEEFQNHADQVMGFGTASFGHFCAKVLLLAMNWLHDLTRIGYGWTIVLITVLIEACSGR